MERIIEKNLSSNILSDEQGLLGTFVRNYLEQSYSIKKKGTCYYLKKKGRKCVVDEITIFKLAKHNNTSLIEKNTFINHFLIKSLTNNWTIEKKQNDFVLTKKHQGKKEYFSPAFLSGFMENNF